MSVGIRRWIRGLLRLLATWLDPRSRRPLILLAVVALGVVVGPLAVDFASAWFFAIPWSVRWAMGQGALIAGIAVGIARLCVVQPSDRWLDRDAEVGGAGRWIPWVLRLLSACLAIPILSHPNGLGFADWDFVLDKFEAVRRTILIWGQFPWWNPWCRGGFPLAAEPQIGVVSIATPLVLALGTTIGLRIAAIICVGLAVEGAYRFARGWLGDPWASAAVALIYGLNGAVAVSLAAGYIIAMSYASLPWMALHAARIGERRSHGLWLGFWTAFTLLNGLQYISLYAVVLASAFWIRALRLQPSGRRMTLIRNTIAAVGVFLALSGWRLATVYPVLRADQREAITIWDESILGACRYLIDRPRVDWPEITGRHWDWYVSVTSYVGPLVVLLVPLSLRRGWRWWHTLVIVSGWLAIGARWWYHPSYWLADWPFIGSAHVVTRWRFVAMLGLGLSAGSVLARWRASGSRRLGMLAIAAVLLIASDYAELAFEQLPMAFSVKPEPHWFPGPPVREIVNVGDGMGYPCVSRGYGVIRGYEPMLSYHRDAPTLRQARGEPGYRGEAWTADGEIQPTFWSPNRIVFQVRPVEKVFINQNPGSWWLVNGRRVFDGDRCAEPLEPFVATADDSGRIVLTIDPPEWPVGVVLHLVGIALVIATRIKATKPPPA